MTVCNMSIEGGARAGLVAPMKKRSHFEGPPDGPEGRCLDAAMRYWETLRSDDGAHFDHEIRLDAAKHAADRDLGHLARGRGLGHRFSSSDPTRSKTRPSGCSKHRALNYMGLKPGTKDHRHQARPHLHRLLHQRPDRGFTRRGESSRRARPSTAISTP